MVECYPASAAPNLRLLGGWSGVRSNELRSGCEQTCPSSVRSSLVGTPQGTLTNAATAIANDLPLYTCNPDDFEAIGGLSVHPVSLPSTP
jgi:hypothetical protein